MKKRQLTREWLNNQKITLEDGKIYHETPYKGKVELHPVINTQNKKYGKNMSYYIVGWYNRYEHKQYAFPLHRVLYALHYGEAPVDKDIDHINGDSLDNRIENLQPITHKENMQKRLGGGRNQYIIMKEQGMSKKAQDDYYDECERAAKYHMNPEFLREWEELGKKFDAMTDEEYYKYEQDMILARDGE